MTRPIRNVRDLVNVALRRKWSIVIPALTVFALAAALACTAPKRYRATATILIETQEIPSEYVKADIGSFADQRIQKINQQIMGAPRLLEMARRLGLYRDSLGSADMEEILEKMRKDIKLVPISVDVIDPRTGHPAQATIAFSVSYQGRDPQVVLQVVNELSSRYVEENSAGRDRQSERTLSFLQDEMATLEQKLYAIDRRITDFKRKNIDALPEHSQVNVQSFESVDREMRALQEQLRAAREKEGSLQSQLAHVEPALKTGQRESLRQLELRLTDLKSRFSDAHPDVKKTRYEISELQRRLSSKEGTEGEPDNPAFVTLSAQLAATRSDIASLSRQAEELNSKKESYQTRIQASPLVEEGYKAILVERNNLQQKYDDLAKKAMEAKLASGLEKEQLGERLTVVDPARLPQKPVSPNIPAILVIAAAVGMGCGIAAAAAREALDDTLRSGEDLAALGFEVLAVIPELGRGRGGAKNLAQRWFT